ncbi:MAG: hypothetical protein LBM00_10750 [Deltaproteobacteria bacterium]|nr:hypothetical protein [Deltaproteobacteria bacterium]
MIKYVIMMIISLMAFTVSSCTAARPPLPGDWQADVNNEVEGIRSIFYRDDKIINIRYEQPPEPCEMIEPLFDLKLNPVSGYCGYVNAVIGSRNMFYFYGHDGYKAVVRERSFRVDK